MNVLMDSTRPKLENAFHVSSSYSLYWVWQLRSIGYFLAGQKILIVNGKSWDNGRRTEIIDLEDSTYTCSKVNQFPDRLCSSTGGLVGSTPFVCGGQGYSSGYTKACYTLQDNGAWIQDPAASLNTARNQAAFGSVVINGKLVIAGGYNGRNYMSSIELVSPKSRSTTLPISLPRLDRSCIVSWDADTFMVIGGYNYSAYNSETYFITPNNNTVRNGPKLLKARNWVACQNMVVNGEEFIIVVGGHGSSTTRTIEVLSKANFKDGWKMGKKYV